MQILYELTYYLRCLLHSNSSLMCLLYFSTLRRWRGGQQVDAWEAHKTAVQAIVKLPSGEFVTGNIFMFLSII